MSHGASKARRFDALLIDFYGTISAGDRCAVERTCACVIDALGLPISAAELAVRWGEQFFQAIAHSNHDAFRTLYDCEIASLRQTLGEWVGDLHVLEVEPLVTDLEAYWRSPPIHSDALELLERLDLQVCCVSNADDGPLAAAIREHGLRFDSVITSQGVRCYKPEAAIFRAATQALGVSPDRVLHVGDSLHSDVGGASRAGIATAWLCRNDRIHDIGTSTPDYTISSLAEICALIC